MHPCLVWRCLGWLKEVSRSVGRVCFECRLAKLCGRAIGKNFRTLDLWPLTTFCIGLRICDSPLFVGEKWFFDIQVLISVGVASWPLLEKLFAFGWKRTITRFWTRVRWRLWILLSGRTPKCMVLSRCPRGLSVTPCFPAHTSIKRRVSNSKSEPIKGSLILSRPRPRRLRP